jgi:hypothetical protein|tara:strand:- start:178 stop:405 length:228 start_codon:yes stop_codon:yes gene_type:complete
MSESISITGDPIRDGQTVSVDHTVTEFKVVVRTSSVRIGPETIKDLIQQKFEVVKCEVVDSQHYVKPTNLPDFPE